MKTSKLLPKGFTAFLATETLGAFNDNLYKMLLQLYVIQVLLPQNSESIISQASLLFTLPFVLFGPWSGYFADHFSKTKVMRFVKFCEIPIMGLALAAFFLKSVPLMLFVLFCMALHSTFFGPAKAGFIPETCPDEGISRANSLLGMTTFLAIIGGMAFAGEIFRHHLQAPYVSVYYCLGVALLGFLASCKIPLTLPKASTGKFPFNPLSGIFRDLAFLKGKKGLFLASLANSYFWLLGLVFTNNILVYGKKILGLSEAQSLELSLLPAVLGIGIAAGSLLAGRWSGKKVELGLVPLGGLGMAVTGLALGFSGHSYPLTASILFISGICGGLFVVPLNSYLQFEAPEEEKGRVLATNGILNGLFLVLGSVLYHLLSVVLQLKASTIYPVMALLNLAVVAYICTVIPEYFLRFMAWLLTHTFYKIRIVGAENVPFHGPALLSANHISYVDALLVGATIQRFIKFIMYKKIYELPLVRQLCAFMEVIPIAPYEGKESVQRSLDAAREKLRSGEVVCIFPEGKITRDGQINEFRHGLESIMQGVDCPIIPVYLHNVWGSIFSFSDKKVLWKFPKKIPYPITIVYGEPLPADSKASEVENAVKALALKALD